MRLSWLLAVPALAWSFACHAEVTRFEVLQRNPQAFGGRSFEGGMAEKITARVTVALDPSDPHNTVIVDLDHAPRMADGKVEASAEVVLLRPARGNGTLVVDVLNRGRKRISTVLNDLTEAQGLRQELAEDGGNGFLLEQGFTVAWIGWQADVAADPVLMRASLPVAVGVAGRSRDEIVLTGTGPRRVTLAHPSAEPARAVLAMRARADAPSQTPEGLGFRFIDSRTIEITPPAGAPAGALYDFSYDARDPVIAGVGLAILRDVTSFLRRDGTPANPLAADGQSRIRHSIGLGISLSGRVLRDFLYFGMNQDEHGRQVLDGAMPIIPGARRSFVNDHFAQPGRNPGPEFDRRYPVLQFPFTYKVLDDAVSGRRDGILLRCLATNSCPNIMQIDSEFEFWGSQASLVVTDTAGQPVEMPKNVRLYLMPGTPHGNVWNAVASKTAQCTLPLNPNTGAPTTRALLVAMQDWIAQGVRPPQSRYPDRAQGTLVRLEEAYLPIPRLAYQRQQVVAEFVEQTALGPVVRGTYPLFVPRTGVDGNVVAGVRLPILAAPRATYTGWNPIMGMKGAQDLCTQMGGVVPLPARADPSDPRPSLEALYPTQAAYVAAVQLAAQDLVAARLLLPADAAIAVASAQAGSLAKLGALEEGGGAVGSK
jgi:hypothetical protein